MSRDAIRSPRKGVSLSSSSTSPRARRTAIRVGWNTHVSQAARPRRCSHRRESRVRRPGAGPSSGHATRRYRRAGVTITLTKGGKAVKSLKPGSYVVTVNDRASVHNFHLLGSGVNKVITTVQFVGKKSVTVTLKKGTYTFQCDVHAASGMKGTFKVA